MKSTRANLLALKLAEELKTKVIPKEEGPKADRPVIGLAAGNFADYVENYRDNVLPRRKPGTTGNQSD